MLGIIINFSNNKSPLWWYYSVCGSFCSMSVMLLNRDIVHLSVGVESPFVITSGAMSNYGPNGLNRMNDNCMLLPAKYFGCFFCRHMHWALAVFMVTCLCLYCLWEGIEYTVGGMRGQI